MTAAMIGSRRRRRRGVTLRDVLVSLFLILVIGGVVFGMGVRKRLREADNRVRCAANLKIIGQTMLLYGCEAKGKYPRTTFVPGDPLTQFTGARAKFAFGKDDSPKPNDMSAAAYLLVKTQEITTEVFICPSTGAGRMEFEGVGVGGTDYSNFTAPSQLGYSSSNRYPSYKAMVAGYKQDSTCGSNFALAADLNPGTLGDYDVTPAKGPKDANAPPEVMRRANSMNHRGAGQNVLFGDGHVDFVTHPFVGQDGDNIYTVSGGEDGTVKTSATIAGSPAWAGDSVLLPVASADPSGRK